LRQKLLQIFRRLTARRDGVQGGVQVSARFCSVMSRYEAYAPTFLPFTITGEVESSTSTRMRLPPSSRLQREFVLRPDGLLYPRRFPHNGRAGR